MIRLLRYLRISNTMFEVKVISSSLNFIFISPSYFLTTLLMLFSPVPCIASDFFDDAMRLFLTATIFLTEFVSCIDRYLFLRTKAEKSINPFSVFCAASTAFSRRLSSRAVMSGSLIKLKSALLMSIFIFTPNLSQKDLYLLTIELTIGLLQ